MKNVKFLFCTMEDLTLAYYRGDDKLLDDFVSLTMGISLTVSRNDNNQRLICEHKYFISAVARATESLITFTLAVIYLILCWP